jgi:MerR family transcriptional regulator, mercuric resistance operon regulatory protein
MISQLQRFTTGGLSKRTGCNIETIRYYERIGLLPEPPRTSGGHRIYDDDDLKRLTFIRRSRELGFTLEEVRELLGLVDGGDYTCAEVKTITVAHLNEVRQKITDLRNLERVLDDMVSQCDDGMIPDCPIIDALFILQP